jgi:DNA-binding transcriptional MocR family regulator
MTIWNPEIAQRSGPTYRAIADALAEDIETGDLRPGDRLPTHRDLAARVGVTLTTVTRAYAEAERRGLTEGTVGRGTFVSARKLERQAKGAMDLRVNALFPHTFGDELKAIMARIAGSASAEALFHYPPSAGAPQHRAAGSSWIARSGLEAPGERLLLTSGAQHALSLVLAVLTHPGDVIFVEELTYVGMISLAEQLHVELHPIAMDDGGMIPDALEAACGTQRGKVLYCMPSGQNPTASVMPAKRRQEIARIAEAFELAVVEDDTYGFTVDDLPPLSAQIPTQSYYIAGTSKSLLPGFRIGYLLAPDQGMAEELEASICASTMAVAPSMAEMLTAIIADGTAARIVAWKRREIATRQRVARRILDESLIEGDERSMHLWMRLPAPWSNDGFGSAAAREGVQLCSADAFSVDPDSTTRAVRICLGAAPGAVELEETLKLIANLAIRRPARRTMAV